MRTGPRWSIGMFMPASSVPAQNLTKKPCPPRDLRVAAAVKAVSVESFPPLVAGAREMPVEATIRMLEDLHVAVGSRVLIVEPSSGYLPRLLGRLAIQVTVVCADAVRAQAIREQLTNAGAANVEVQTFVQDRGDDDRDYGRMVIMQPANDELG